MSNLEIWVTIVALGVGTFLIRWSFLGALGDRELPIWAVRLLRYTPVTVLPALVAPLAVWPEAAGGQPEPARLTAAAVTVAIGVLTKNVVLATLCGVLVLFGMLYVLG